LVRQYDYRSRDANRIHELFATWGLGHKLIKGIPSGIEM
jgi:hypothetical protein